jgi:hypothetical protein
MPLGCSQSRTPAASARDRLNAQGVDGHVLQRRRRKRCPTLFPPALAELGRLVAVVHQYGCGKPCRNRPQRARIEDAKASATRLQSCAHVHAAFVAGEVIRSAPSESVAVHAPEVACAKRERSGRIGPAERGVRATDPALTSAHRPGGRSKRGSIPRFERAAVTVRKVLNDRGVQQAFLLTARRGCTLRAALANPLHHRVGARPVWQGL